MAKTIYECYKMNGNKAGFWVRRHTWDEENSFFVKRIGQQTSGQLALDGPFRYNLPVWGDLYRGDTIVNRNARLEFPATYSWSYLGSEKSNRKVWR